MNKKHPAFKKLETVLGYTFKKLDLLKESLIHKSYAHEHPALNIKNNERFEFLGDAVLELVITDLIIKRFPDSLEGELSRIRASIVNEKELADLASRLGLSPWVLLGKGEEKTRGRVKSSILANTYEAILAALYLDGGYAAAYQVIREHFWKIIDAAACSDFDRDYKTKLQEKIQKKFKKIPEYTIIEEIGPNHHKTFNVKVTISDELFAFGSGKSKKEAEQDAARLALQVLKEQDLF